MVNQSIDDSGMQKKKRKISCAQSVSQCALMNGHSMLKKSIYILSQQKKNDSIQSIHSSVCL